MTVMRCYGCGGPFDTNHPRQRICRACPGGIWQDGRFYFVRTCQVCRQDFHTQVRTQKTCSTSCGGKLGNARKDLQDSVEAISERLHDAPIQHAAVTLTPLRKRLTPEEAEQLKRCPTCGGKILLVPDPDEPHVLTLSCLLCGRPQGQLRPKARPGRFGYAPLPAKS